ncbi:MAG: hypothetical protein MK171_04530 [Pirellulales bacterium]|nr:hypothetical protein [Pirellulales bacterium]
MPGVFEDYGLRFQYPDNWSVEHAAAPRDAHDLLQVEHRLAKHTSEPNQDSCGQTMQVSVASPDTGFWQLSQYPAGVELEPLFDEALAALRREYESMEVEPCSDALEGFHLSGYNVQFFCMDLTSTCWLRGLAASEATYLLLCQAEDREFEGVGPVFRAMLASVLRNIA